MTNELKAHLKSNPQISHVYLNEDNEWQFHARKGYDKVLTRAQVLAAKVSDETADNTNVIALQTQAGKVTEDTAKKAADAPAGELHGLGNLTPEEIAIIVKAREKAGKATKVTATPASQVKPATDVKSDKDATNTDAEESQVDPKINTDLSLTDEDKK